MGKQVGMTKAEAKEIHKIWKGNLRFFVEDLLKHYLTSSIPDFHNDIYKLVTKERRLCLAAPRGFAKSMICSVFYPLHSALFSLKRDICIISASEGLAVEWLRKIKGELESNQLILRYFGDMRSAKWSENHIILNNKYKTSIRARGAGGQIRGFRPDLIILDDIETEDTVASTEQRNKLRDWIFKACLNTLLPEGQFVWIGTIISPLALLQEMLEKDTPWKRIKYRAYKDSRQKAGYELWKDLWSHEKLQVRKQEIGSFAFAAEYMNDPISSEDAPIKPHNIQYFESLPDSYTCVIVVDPAYSEDERADYKTASVVCSDNRNNRYLAEYIRTHRPQGEFIDSFLNLYLKYQEKCVGLGVPDSGTEKEFFRSVVNRITERQIPVSLIPLKNAFVRSGASTVIRRKKDRIVAALQPIFEQGRYFLKSNQSEAIDELLALGATRHDDIVDTLCYAEQLIQPGYDFDTNVVAKDRYGMVIDPKSKFVSDYGYD